MSCVFRTEGLHGYSVKFSPYIANRIAAVVCQQFGISGCAKLLVIDVNVLNGTTSLIDSFDWLDALFDVTWSESSASLLVAAGGDGSVIVWDLTHGQSLTALLSVFKLGINEQISHFIAWMDAGQLPVMVLKEHTKEVYCVDWSTTRDIQMILSSSWDTTIKLWDIHRSRASLSTFSGHEGVVYSAVWSPLVTACFASTSDLKFKTRMPSKCCVKCADGEIRYTRANSSCCCWLSGDTTARVWDTRKSHMSQIVIAGHSNAEVLSCDWCKYDQHLLATGSTDGLVRVWDLRNPRQSICELHGHTYAVRRIKFSPFSSHHLVSSSYDFTVRIWDWTRAIAEETIEHHTEFVYGLDCSSHNTGQVVDCSWDQTVKVYSPRSLQQPTT